MACRALLESMTTTKTKNSGLHLREAEGCVSDSRKHQCSNPHATPHTTTYTRSSCYAELPDVLLRRMITYLGSAAVDSLTLLASVCRGWRDVVHNHDECWRDALLEALPFLRTTGGGNQASLGATEMQSASSEVVKAIVGRVGGYRQLWVKYMKAVHAPLQLPGSISRPTRIRSSVLNSEFYMIFNIYDRMKDCFIMSVAGRGVVPPMEETFGDRSYVYHRMQVDDRQRAAYIHPPFNISAMLMPWEYDEDNQFNDLMRMMRKTGRFVARAFMINGQGCVTMLYASDVDKGFEEFSDEFDWTFEASKAQLRPAEAMGFNNLLAAAKVSFDLRNHPRGGRWGVSDDAHLNIYIKDEDSHAIGEVLHYLLSLR